MEVIKKIRTNEGDLQIDYESLANLPTVNGKSITGNLENYDLPSNMEIVNARTGYSRTQYQSLSERIAGDVNSVIEILNTENEKLIAENLKLSKELENQKLINQENTLLMNTILGVE